MLQQAIDLREEGAALRDFLAELEDADWARPTPFKDWTVNAVIQHLHSGDWMASVSLEDPERFARLLAARRAARERGDGSSGLGENAPELREGPALLEQWWRLLSRLGGLLEAADPDRRVAWVGPDMGVRSFATARQMETWAHGQDIYDLVQAPREHFDRLGNICVLGCQTFGWTFRNRGLEPPGLAPYVRLTLPSGALWERGKESRTDSVEGTALDFCRVVTQGRNIADVALEVTGEPARAWMAIAQCFAGPPNDPPAPGARVWERGRDTLGGT